MRFKTAKRYPKQDTKVHDIIVSIRGGGVSNAESEEVEVVNETAKLHILLLLVLCTLA